MSVYFVIFIIKLGYFILSLGHHFLLLVGGDRRALILLYSYLLLLYLVDTCLVAVGTKVFDEMLQVVDRLGVVSILRLIQILGLEEAL